MEIFNSYTYVPFVCCQSVPKPPPAAPTKKRKRVVEEPPEVLAPKPLLSGAVPLDGFLATLHKVPQRTPCSTYGSDCRGYGSDCSTYGSDCRCYGSD